MGPRSVPPHPHLSGPCSQKLGSASQWEVQGALSGTCISGNHKEGDQLWLVCAGHLGYSILAPSSSLFSSKSFCIGMELTVWGGGLGISLYIACLW